jgi:hypothetical protein
MTDFDIFPHVIHVPWPKERIMWVNVEGYEVESWSADPNEIMRPSLEQDVGVQGIDWNWEISQVKNNSVAIYFMDITEAIKYKLLWS